jgi:hypothetical protein
VGHFTRRLCRVDRLAKKKKIKRWTVKKVSPPRSPRDFRLGAPAKGPNLYLSGKKIARILKRLKKAPGLDASEALLLARSLATTPQERWEFNLAALRFYNSFPSP